MRPSIRLGTYVCVKSVSCCTISNLRCTKCSSIGPYLPHRLRRPARSCTKLHCTSSADDQCPITLAKCAERCYRTPNWHWPYSRYVS
ncbi:hypothetical protein LY76DRAFT_425643 [Colletotrichum caudatum]|nr:hypothetical protein LY76DRAFT_425643 [Colletotrichum caudatum]